MEHQVKKENKGRRAKQGHAGRRVPKVSKARRGHEDPADNACRRGIRRHVFSL